MNKQDQMTMQEAERKMESLREVFQVVRLVDGKMLMDREKRINAGDLSETCQCYSFWKKDKECENCSSLLALKEQTQKIKFEFLDLQVFQVISRYVEIDGRPYVMEMIQNLDESAKRTMTYESLMNRIMDYFYDTEIIAMSKVMAYNVWKTMQEVCKENLEKSLDDIVEDVEDACGVFVEYLEKKYQLENVISDISEIIENGGITYDKTLDKICLIVDRDKDSFVSGQYKYVVDKCKECGFMLCVSNPCFEFWLLLHFDEVLSLDKDKLLNNPKMNAKRRYAEYSLKIVYPGYRKSSYCAERFVKNIDIAIENEKKFCEDINELEHTVGSNIGVLIEEMRRH